MSVSLVIRPHRCSINVCSMNGISGLSREGKLVRITGHGGPLFLNYLLLSSHTPSTEPHPLKYQEGKC